MATFNIRIFICRQVVEPWDLTKICDKLKIMHMSCICHITSTQEYVCFNLTPRKKVLPTIQHCHRTMHYIATFCSIIVDNYENFSHKFSNNNKTLNVKKKVFHTSQIYINSLYCLAEIKLLNESQTLRSI